MGRSVLTGILGGVPVITAVLGDITKQNVDAIVNAANNVMRGGGGVDGAIHRGGGPAILRDCIERFPDGLATGDAGWTTAGDLPAQWVIHTVGPNYRAGQRDRSLLTSCYLRALEVADKLGARSVAFPWALEGMATRSVRRARTLIDSTPLGELEHWETSALRSDLLMLRDAIDAMLTQMEPQAL
jgi:O-acetyl-ADP-ribose deacetylase (regulator of RNase III)